MSIDCGQIVYVCDQLASCGSTFYASGYDAGNKDGWVLMQTLSGVADDGREVVAVVAPGKHSAGKSVTVEARHVVDKPKDLDWERAAMLPFLVRIAYEAVQNLLLLLLLRFHRSNQSAPYGIPSQRHHLRLPWLLRS